MSIRRPRLQILQMLVGESQGGAETFFVKLAIAFQEAGVRQKLVVGMEPNRIAMLREGGCDVLPIRFGGSLDIVRRIQLQIAVKRFRPDVVVVWMNRAARRMPRGSFVRVGRLGGYYPLKYYRSCDYLIANAPDLVEHMARSGWPRERAVMISNFADLPARPAVSRSDLATPEDVPVMLALGRLHPQKGFDTLIRALGRVPSAWLWLAGEGQLRSELEALAEEQGVRGRVRFLGWRNDQAALYAAADLCVVPSRHEPLSNVTLEAWQHGCPVVACASEGPSWLIDSGRNGLLVPVDDDEALGAAIAHVLGSPQQAARLAQEGLATYEERFSKTAIVDQYLALFSRALAGEDRASSFV